jgi:hypothetical protein
MCKTLFFAGFLLVNKAEHNFLMYFTLNNNLSGEAKRDERENKEPNGFPSLSGPLGYVYMLRFWPKKIKRAMVIWCSVMRGNFLIIFIQIFLINSLIFFSFGRSIRGAWGWMEEEV